MVSYNGFIQLKNKIDNSWSQIDVQLKRRFGLVPNLVETVKDYTKHEKGTLKAITVARAVILISGSQKEQIENENLLTRALKSLFAVSESYLNLKGKPEFYLHARTTF
jgi:LemA protein